MTALLPIDWIDRRRLVSPGGAWAPLADALRREIDPLLARALPIPERKARLTRAGGRCPHDGTLLVFDPWSPDRHPCPRCAFVGTRPEDHDWWAMGAQLWTVERAVHAAALFALRGEAAMQSLAWRILETLADRYAQWPNRDNVLGPTRPFFSTYLESIWLLNACHALALLEHDGSDERGGRVRDRLLAPSATLVASFHEGRSNRQVWNEVALLAAWQLLGERGRLDARLAAPGGLPSLLVEGLLEDGTWYEGENYHLFAHRGLWYGVQLLRTLDRPLASEALRRFRLGFTTPFLGLLPDDTFPSRRDAQYAVSARQWRIAEWCELGIAELTMTGPARDPDRDAVTGVAREAQMGAMLSGVLARLYDGTAPARDTERSRSMADVERNDAATRLSRADGSWRALLCARAELPDPARWTSSSVCLPAQGLAVLRRDRGRTYIALEGGHTGGGHGHPDRLALTLQHGPARWLDDPGTGSYVDPSLHWYRSTLAHHAPLVGDASQRAAPATLLAWEDRGGAGWVSKRADGIAPGVTITRSVVACDGYLVDLVEWEGAGDRPVMLSVAAEAHESNLPDGDGDAGWTEATLRGQGGLEDGFGFLSSARQCAMPPVLRLDAAAPGTTSVARLWCAGNAPATVVRAIAPGPPGWPSRARHWVRLHAPTGRLVSVWSWPRIDGEPLVVVDVALDPHGAPVAVVTTRDGTRAEHAPADHGWHIDLTATGARSSIDLEGRRAPASIDGPRTPRTSADVTASPDTSPDTSPETAHPQPADMPPESAAAVHPLVLPRLPDSVAAAVPGTPMPGALVTTLAESCYRATEDPWQRAGTPEATVSLGVTADEFVIDVVARTGPIVVPEPHAENPLDNEHPDVNADGLQWYVAVRPGEPWRAAGLLLPADLVPGTIRHRPLVPDSPLGAAAWCATIDGWAARLRLPLASCAAADGTFAFDLVVNERPPGRERRRGQLVLSGSDGRAYLRGDRQSSDRALVLAVPPPAGGTSPHRVPDDRPQATPS